ncbi:MAG TPA: FUSC family protein [Streptosporangiaceae bacterium]|nr:FUSC family protein [Streptosporangiaceae bacterium]
MSWHPVAYLRARDPELLAVKRAARAAVVMPATFAIARAITSDTQLPLFASFGAFALLLLVDLGGSKASRLRSYAALIVTAVPLIVVGSLCSNRDVLAVASMAVAAFVVLFAGVLSPRAAQGSMYLLLAFVLPVSIPVPAGEIGFRLAGWALAAVLGLPAILLIWPRPWHDTHRAALAEATEQLAALVRAHAEGHRDRAAHDRAGRAVHDLRDGFAATPYPPTGIGPTQVALAKMVSRIEWAASLTVVGPEEVDLALRSPTARELNAATARTLCATGTIIGDGPDGHRPGQAAAAELTAALADLHRDRRASLQWAVERLVHQVTCPPGSTGPSGSTGRLAETALAFIDPASRARTLGLATEEIGSLALEAADTRPPGESRRARWLAAARAGRIRAAAHLNLRSVWLRNSLRGAAGLALAVAVARITGVSHAFWVALGAMSVLRSNALGTGATALRAVGGTVVGFAIGTVIMLGVGAHTAPLWFILPLVVFVAGVAPAVISFAAGQAGFTIMVIILFNILVPTGWQVGLVRVEDVALGCAVSVGVGLLFWPRGAAAAFGQALCEAYRASSGYLVAAVDRLVSPRLTGSTQQPADRATVTYHRLEDAYRQFLSERGAKVISLRTATHLLTGAARLRLAAQSLATLPVQPLDPGAPAHPASVAVAGAAAALRCAYHRTDTWYDCFAGVLRGEQGQAVPVHAMPVQAMPVAADSHGEVRGQLVHAFELASAASDVTGIRMVLRLLWADGYLIDEEASQRDLAGSARSLAARGIGPLGRLSHAASQLTG